MHDFVEQGRPVHVAVEAGDNLDGALLLVALTEVVSEVIDPLHSPRTAKDVYVIDGHIDCNPAG